MPHIHCVQQQNHTASYISSHGIPNLNLILMKFISHLITQKPSMYAVIIRYVSAIILKSYPNIPNTNYD